MPLPTLPNGCACTARPPYVPPLPHTSQIRANRTAAGKRHTGAPRGRLRSQHTPRDGPWRGPPRRQAKEPQQWPSGGVGKLGGALSNNDYLSPVNSKKIEVMDVTDPVLSQGLETSTTQALPVQCVWVGACRKPDPPARPVEAKQRILIQTDGEIPARLAAQPLPVGGGSRSLQVKRKPPRCDRGFPSMCNPGGGICGRRGNRREPVRAGTQHASTACQLHPRSSWAELASTLLRFLVMLYGCWSIMSGCRV